MSKIAEIEWSVSDGSMAQTVSLSFEMEASEFDPEASDDDILDQIQRAVDEDFSQKVSWYIEDSPGMIARVRKAMQPG